MQGTVCQAEGTAFQLWEQQMQRHWDRNKLGELMSIAEASVAGTGVEQEELGPLGRQGCGT